jgi:hypothetical protein
MTTRREVLGWIVGGAGTLALSATGAELVRERSVLKDVAGLETPVTITEAKIPLGELVARIATETGVSLRAAREVADEPVALVVRDMPARELLEEFAHLLDYRWSRRGKREAWRYEIGQDVAAKQREEALRQAIYAGTEKRFRQEVQQHIEMAVLSQQQIQAILDAEEQRRKRLEKLPPEQQWALLTSPEEQSQSRRAQVAGALSSPIKRSLARLLGGLTPQQRNALLREGKEIVFSTDPQPGELPLPPDTNRILSTERPVSSPPGTIVFPDDPRAEALRHQRERETQDQWAAAKAYRVILRMNFTPTEPMGSSGGLYALRVEAGARLTQPTGSFFMSAGLGSTLLISGRPLDLLLQDLSEQKRSQRRTEGEKDPVLGEKKLFRVPMSSHSASATLGGEARPLLLDLLLELARTYDVHFISDAYWNSSPILDLAAVTGEPTSLSTLLDRSAWFTHRWERRGRLVRLRSRTWFFDRPREVPLRLVRRWKALIERFSELPLDEYLAIATTLNDDQLATADRIIRAIGLPQTFTRSRPTWHALRLYASLTPAQQLALWQGQRLSVAEMTRPQRELFLKAVRSQAQILPTPMNPEQPAEGSFSATRNRFVRVSEQGEGVTRYQDERTSEPAAAPPAKRDSDRTPGIRFSDEAVRRSIMRLEFHFTYGPELRGTVDLMVSMPT